MSTENNSMLFKNDLLHIFAHRLSNRNTIYGHNVWFVGVWNPLARNRLDALTSTNSYALDNSDEWKSFLKKVNKVLVCEDESGTIQDEIHLTLWDTDKIIISETFHHGVYTIPPTVLIENDKLYGISFMMGNDTFNSTLRYNDNISFPIHYFLTVE